MARTEPTLNPPSRAEMRPLEPIPVFAPCTGIDTIKHVTDAFDVGWLGMGATTKEFEERIAAFLELENRYVVATNTGTSALHLALLVAGIGPGDEVITPSFNYVADHQAIHAAGAEVVMCDVRDDNRGIDVAKAEALISERTKAIVPLHFAGIPCDQAGVYELARKYKLRVIEDAMHGFGTRIEGKRIGSYGDIACFSFDPVKIVTSIDGGCVIVNDPGDVERLRHYRFLGVDRETAERYKNQRAWEYDVVSEGFRYHLTNILASVGVSQIKRVEEFIRSRVEVCRRYNAAFGSVAGLRIPESDFTDVSPFIYSLRVEGGKREALIEHMKARNVAAGIHFVPVHKHAYFADARRGDMGVTDRVVEESLTIPLHSNMRPDFVERTIEAILSFYR
ncbi:MAG: DegT/DnrJ/EryC1/StrS family aminotransferase [Candidatus Eremiobacteraeota bacterium]|nr:DegT/DnrJ/EryC1/StrS family aminotransferase [Candidatus Eremiobacteraeota bacterium]